MSVSCSAIRVGVEVWFARIELMPDLPVWTDEWCQAFLGARPLAVLFFVSHLSEVVGVRLTDGREVVVKRRVDESGRAGRCVEAQKLLAEQGFPCPMPLTDVIVRGRRGACRAVCSRGRG
jgi:hypothetical protein